MNLQLPEFTFPSRATELPIYLSTVVCYYLTLRYRYLVVGTLLVPNIVPIVRWISGTRVIENWLAWFIRKLRAFAEWIYIRSKVGNLVCHNRIAMISSHGFGFGYLNTRYVAAEYILFSRIIFLTV
jgi:hypothetical protein